LPEKVESSLRVVKRNSDRLLSLTEDLLDVQRMDAGRLKLNFELISINEIIDDCIEEIQPFVDERKQGIRLKIPDRLHDIIVQGDRIRMSQVFLNLLLNATKFSPEGSVITLSVEEGVGEFVVKASDTGIGIAQDDLTRVFEPFSAIEKPQYIKGTGLGLSVTKGLIEAHGGRIWAESDGKGKGATFVFTLPKQEVLSVAR
jgi:signal transduction histidine kinase